MKPKKQNRQNDTQRTDNSVARRERDLFSLVSGIAGLLLAVPAAVPLTVFLAYLMGKHVDTHKMCEPANLLYLIASLVLGICMIIGLCRGISGLRTGRRSRGMSIAGVILSTLGMILTIVIICLLWQTAELTAQ